MGNMVSIALALDNTRKYNEKINKILEIKKMKETLGATPLLNQQKILCENE